MFLLKKRDWLSADPTLETLFHPLEWQVYLSSSGSFSDQFQIPLQKEKKSCVATLDVPWTPEVCYEITAVAGPIVFKPSVRPGKIDACCERLSEGDD